MKMSKRLLAVMMVVALVLTLVPFGLFAFADDPAPTTHYIASFDDLKKIGVGEWKLSDNYVMTTDIVLQSAEEKLEANYDSADAGLKLELNPKYTQASSFVAGDKYYTKTSTDPDPEVFELADNVNAENVTNYYTASYDSIEFSALSNSQKATLISEYNYTNDSKDFTMIAGDFTGIFDGNSHKISGISVTSNVDSVALFSVNKGTIKDLTLDNRCSFTLNSSKDAFVNSAASFVATNEGKLQNLKSSASISVTNKLDVVCIYVGGITAMNEDGHIIVLFNKKADFDAGKYYVADGDSFIPATGTFDESAKYYTYNGFTPEITGCEFNGRIDYKCSDGTFSDTSKLDDKDTILIGIGGIAGRSDIAITGTYNGKIFSQFVGGENVSAYTISAAQKVVGEKTGITTITSEQKIVGNDKVASAITGVNENSYTYGTPNDKGYQLVTTVTADGPVYYIRQIVCDHANKESHPAKAETCGDDGNIAYWYCPDCEKYFSDEECTKVISDVKDTVIEAKGEHTEDQNYPVTIVTQPTATAEGEKTFTCSVCHQVVTAPIDKTPGVTAPAESGYSFTVSTVKVTLSNKDGITAAGFISTLDSLDPLYSYQIKDSKGKIVDDDSLIGTGYTIEVVGSENSKITIIVAGDVNGDGKIRANDAKIALDASANISSLSGVFETAANVDGKAGVKASDAKRILDFASGVSTKKFN